MSKVNTTSLGASSRDEDTLLVISEISPEDVEQEAALFEWLHREEGKRANKAIIKRNLGKIHREYLFSTWSDTYTLIEWQSAHPEVPQVTIERIVNWAIEQSEDIQEKVFQFLESPSEEELKGLLMFLKKTGTIEKVPNLKKMGAKSVSLRVLIMNLLEDGQPHSVQSLYELARSTMNSARPESAVRQAIRRLLRAKTVFEPELGYYCLRQS